MTLQQCCGTLSYYFLNDVGKWRAERPVRGTGSRFTHHTRLFMLEMAQKQLRHHLMNLFPEIMRLNYAGVMLI